MNKYNKVIIAIAMTAILGACSTVSGGRYQPVTVTTVDTKGSIIHGADCSLTNARGVTYGKSGAPVTVKTDNTPLDVKCTTPALSGEESIDNKLNPAVFGNILIGGLIGVIVDVSTDAASRYDRLVNVIMKTSESETAAE